MRLWIHKLVAIMNNCIQKGYYTSEDLKKLGIKKVGVNVLIAKDATVIGLENISIGNRVRIDSYTNLIVPTGELVLGSNIHIGSNCYVGATGGVYFKNFSAISQGVRIYSATDDFSGRFLTNSTIPTSFTNLIKGEVVLSEHVVVGSGSTILPSCFLGEGCAVGAMSLVRKNLDPWSIYLGAPARKIGDRSKEVLNLANDYLKTIE